MNGRVTKSHVVLDFSGITSKHELLRLVARELRFPDYFGNNWDALVDCLRDIDQWLGPAPLYVLEVLGHGALARREPDLWDEFVRCVEAGASYRAERSLSPLLLRAG